MKILFVLSIDLSTNGPSVHLLNDLISVVSNYHFVDVVCSGGGPLKSEKVKYINAPFVINKSSFLKRYLAASKYAKHSFSLVKKQKYDLIFLQSSPVNYWYTKYFKKFGCPIIYNAQDLFPQNLFFTKQMSGGKIAYWFFNRLERKSYKRMSRIITISNDMKNTILKYVCKDSSKISVVYNWSYSDSPIIPDRCKKSNVSSLFDSSKYNVVYAGNIGRMQNVSVLIEAAELLKEHTHISFIIIGNGVEKERLLKAANHLKNVKFYDLLPSSDAESVYGYADLNFIPLANGGVYVALPSKTATCLRSNKPVLFCINKESEFAKMISLQEGIRVCEPTDTQGVANTILELSKEKKKNYSRTRLLNEQMSSSINPKMYLEIMEKSLN